MRNCIILDIFEWVYVGASLVLGESLELKRQISSRFMNKKYTYFWHIMLISNLF